MSAGTMFAVTCECDTAPLRNALSVVAHVARKNSPRPVLANVRLDVDPENGSTVCATDLEVGVRVRVVGVKADRPFSVLLHPGRLVPILSRTSGPTVTLSLADNRLVVKSAGYKFELASEDPGTYPDFPKPPPGVSYSVPAADLRRVIRLTRFATDPESLRYALGGCLLTWEDADPARGTPGRFGMVGCDGRRLAVATCPGTPSGGVAPERPADRQAVVPVKALTLLERGLDPDGPDVTVCAGGNDAYFAADAVSVYARLLEGRFPQYQQVIPTRPGVKFTVRAPELLDRVSLASVTTSQESKGVDFTLEPGRLTLKAASGDTGNSDVETPVAYDGPAVEWSLTPGLLTELLAAVGDEELEVAVIDGNQPVVFRLGADATFAVMPMTKG